MTSPAPRWPADKKKTGNLFVISAPSGAGKSTLSSELLRTVPNLTYSVSLTTRAPRKGEVEGRDYFFVTDKEFFRRREAGDFIESAQVHGFWYGTPKRELELLLSGGKDVILDIDVQGGRQIKSLFPTAVLVFIAPPSIKELEQRLRNRSQDDEAAIQKRLENARQEIAEAGNYKYLILNREIAESVKRLEGILWAERSRMNPEVLKGVKK